LTESATVDFWPSNRARFKGAVRLWTVILIVRRQTFGTDLLPNHSGVLFTSHSLKFIRSLKQYYITRFDRGIAHPVDGGQTLLQRAFRAS